MISFLRQADPTNLFCKFEEQFLLRVMQLSTENELVNPVTGSAVDSSVKPMKLWRLYESQLQYVSL
jgi:hypothetical protein